MKGTRRGIALNSGATAVIDSHLADFKEVGADSQAIAGWNGPGPFKIVTGKTGKGTITANPNAATYASGTVVVLTATPDPGSPWVGWAGACAGTATTCTLTMTSDKSVTANFK